jgi:hypothetical protein
MNGLMGAPVFAASIFNSMSVPPIMQAGSATSSGRIFRILLGILMGDLRPRCRGANEAGVIVWGARMRPETRQ